MLFEGCRMKRVGTLERKSCQHINGHSRAHLCGRLGCKARESWVESSGAELHVADGRVFGYDPHEASELCTTDLELNGVDALWRWRCPLIAFNKVAGNESGCMSCTKAQLLRFALHLSYPRVVSVQGATAALATLSTCVQCTPRGRSMHALGARPLTRASRGLLGPWMLKPRRPVRSHGA